MNEFISKSIINNGKGRTNFNDGTKVTFHVKTETPNNELIDNSREWKEPVELILGKKFKLEVWEACVKTMSVGEVATFIVDKKLLTPYPIVSKTLRDYHAKKAGKVIETKSHHCCGIGLKAGLGYPDLDALVNSPQSLKFTIELLKVEEVGAYQKEFWAMTEEEQMLSIPVLREEGNKLYKEGSYTEASKKYAEAIARLENLMLKEKPNDVEWKELNEKKLPLLLNYSQCQILLEEYYPAIEHCSEVLKYEPDNVKALFRRGKAYVKVFSISEAEDDLKRVKELDPSLEKGVEKLLKELSMAKKEKLIEDKKAFQKLFT